MGVYEPGKHHNSVKEYSELSGSTTHLSVGDALKWGRIWGSGFRELPVGKNETSYEKNLTQFDPYNQLAFETLTIT